MRKFQCILLAISLGFSLAIVVDSSAAASSGPAYLCRVYSNPETSTIGVNIRDSGSYCYYDFALDAPIYRQNFTLDSTLGFSPYGSIGKILTSCRFSYTLLNSGFRVSSQVFQWSGFVPQGHVGVGTFELVKSSNWNEIAFENATCTYAQNNMSYYGNVSPTRTFGPSANLSQDELTTTIKFVNNFDDDIVFNPIVLVKYASTGYVSKVAYLQGNGCTSFGMRMSAFTSITCSFTHDTNPYEQVFDLNSSLLTKGIPEAIYQPAVKGTAKVGKTLSFKTAEWYRAKSVKSGWVLCKSAVMRVTHFMPTGCTLLKVKGKSLKVTKSMKGKFLATVSVGTNSAGKVAVYSKTTKRIR